MCERIQITRRQAAKAPVAEAGIRLALIERIELDAVFGQSGFHRLGTTEIVQVVFQGAPHEELHAQIIDLFTAGGFSGLSLKRFPLLLEHIAQHHGCGLIELLIGRLNR